MVLVLELHEQNVIIPRLDTCGVVYSARKAHNLSGQAQLLTPQQTEKHGSSERGFIQESGEVIFGARIDLPISSN